MRTDRYNTEKDRIGKQMRRKATRRMETEEKDKERETNVGIVHLIPVLVGRFDVGVIVAGA